MSSKMKVEIWSDVVCPFCYIGKRKLELALNDFADSNDIEIEWKGYQLMPDMADNQHGNVYGLLAERYGIDINQSKAMHAQVTQTASTVGLEYNFDKAIPANTLMAHELIAFAATKGKQSEAEEALFRSYFTEGRNIADMKTLLEIGVNIGLDTTDLEKDLNGHIHRSSVLADIAEGQQLGVRGVPFFVFDRKYAISGAQDPAQFLNALQKSHAEWRTANPKTKMQVSNGKVCTPGKTCN